MSKHASIDGSTCWFCGHGGLRTKTLDGVIYRSCDPCKQVKGGREEIRAALNEDVEQLKRALRYELDPAQYAPKYWTPAHFWQLRSDWRGHNPRFLDKLKWVEYADEFAEATRARKANARSVYMKEFYEKNGGKEAAKAAYRRRKEQALKTAENSMKEIEEKLRGKQ